MQSLAHVMIQIMDKGSRLYCVLTLGQVLCELLDLYYLFKSLYHSLYFTGEEIETERLRYLLKLS